MKMLTGEYVSTTTTYHWVTPYSDDVAWSDNCLLFDEIWEWCHKTFGPPGAWTSRTWMASNCKYFLVKESDRLLYILRWS